MQDGPRTSYRRARQQDTSAHALSCGLQLHATNFEHGERAAKDPPVVENSVGFGPTAVGVYRTIVTSILALSILAATPIGGRGASPANADTDAVVEQTTQVSPRPVSKTRPPPPEIPPGRITIAQWVSRLKVRYVPVRMDLQNADVPTLSDYAKMAEDVKGTLTAGSRKGVGRGGDGGGNQVATEAVSGAVRASRRICRQHGTLLVVVIFCWRPAAQQTK